MKENNWHLFTISGLMMVAFSRIVPDDSKIMVGVIGLFLCISGFILSLDEEEK